MTHTHTTPASKFKTGEKVFYFNTPCEITSVRWNCFDEQHYYNVRYFEGGTRRGATLREFDNALRRAKK